MGDPQVVRRTDRRPASGLPAGSFGEEAFADATGWVGFIRLPPGATSQWHHHGAWVSYAAVQRGVLRWEFGLDGAHAIEIGAGDVGRMPAGRVHRDVSAGDEDLEMVLFRSGEGPLTIDVDGPDGGDA
ncbi:MAG TPA: cupin domain-containing protein [Candidatus Limnocylindria bacterium]|nr:cupin domain-containing protein [Candidatus Limnocylindria bacterium]